MSDENTQTAEAQLAETVKEIAREHGDQAAIAALEEVLEDARDKQLKGEPLVDRTVDIDAYPFDIDNRRRVSEEDGVLVDENGDNVRQGVHGTVEIADVEDGRLILKGDTYDAKAHIKALDYQDRAFDGDRKVWTVDVTAIEELHRHLNGGGFLFVDARGGESEPTIEERRRESLDWLDEFIDGATAGDRVVVEYEQKNGNKTNSKEGTIEKIRLPDEEYRDEPQLVFKRDDGQRMYVEVDEYGKLGLWTSMSFSPFVGAVESLAIAEGVEA